MKDKLKASNEETLTDKVYGEYLKLKSYYLNPMTASVALGEQWEEDFKDRYEQDLSWDEWTGEEGLIEVELDEEGELVEVEI